MQVPALRVLIKLFRALCALTDLLRTPRQLPFASRESTELAPVLRALVKSIAALRN